jgi:hypothetical protein
MPQEQLLNIPPACRRLLAWADWPLIELEPGEPDDLDPAIPLIDDSQVSLSGGRSVLLSLGGPALVERAEMDRVVNSAAPGQVRSSSWLVMNGSGSAALLDPDPDLATEKYF